MNQRLILASIAAVVVGAAVGWMNARLGRVEPLPPGASVALDPSAAACPPCEAAKRRIDMASGFAEALRGDVEWLAARSASGSPAWTEAESTRAVMLIESHRAAAVQDPDALLVLNWTIWLAGRHLESAGGNEADARLTEAVRNAHGDATESTRLVVIEALTKAGYADQRMLRSAAAALRGSQNGVIAASAARLDGEAGSGPATGERSKPGGAR